MARTKQTAKRSIGARQQLARKVLINNISTLRYSYFEVELARTGYARWAGIAVEFVSCNFIYGSALGLSGWANRARKDMMAVLKEAIQGSLSLFSELPDQLIDYMIYDAGRFDYNNMRFNRARLLELGEHRKAHELCARIAKNEMQLTKQILASEAEEPSRG